MFFSNATSCGSSAETKRAPSAVCTRFHLRTARSASAVLLHGGPQTGGMQFGTSTSMASRLPARDHGLALL